jgi:hypothetical protein
MQAAFAAWSADNKEFTSRSGSAAARPAQMLANCLIQRILRPPSAAGGLTPVGSSGAQLPLFFGFFEGSSPKKAAFVQFL